MVVVRDPQRTETGVLGQLSLFDKLSRRVLLTREEVSDPHDVSRLAGRRPSSAFPSDISAKPARTVAVATLRE
jgi:hypothetical protein